MVDLSVEASSVLGSTLGNRGTRLQYHMIDYVPSPEMQHALDELVAAGIVIRETGNDDQPPLAVRYFVKDGFDTTPYRREAYERMLAGTLPGIRVFVPRAATPAKGDDK